MAYIFSSHRSIYTSQRLESAKGHWKGALGGVLRDLPGRGHAASPDS
jgi:hypothetical protein